MKPHRTALTERARCGFFASAAVVLLTGLAGCAGSDETTGPSEVPAETESAAESRADEVTTAAEPPAADSTLASASPDSTDAADAASAAPSTDAAVAVSSSAPEPFVLIDATAPGSIDQWRVVNDGVMGGESASAMAATPDGLEFSGAVSLDNNGGFASIRSDFVAAYDVSPYSALEATLQGDGKTYVIELRTDQQGVNFWQRVVTNRDAAPADYRLELDGFLPHSRFGEPVSDGPALDPARINSIGVYILDKQVGPFRLVLTRISATP